MGCIVHVATGSQVRINRRTLLGRAVTGATRLSSNSSSKEHACIDWDGDGWVLRDLGSRNGTRINDIALADREWRLAVGDRIAFGDAAELWQWTEGSGPCPYALGSDGAEVFGSPTLLVLPDNGSPVVSVYARPDGWELDDGNTQRVVRHEETVSVGGATFRLQLPETPSELTRTRTNQLRPRLATGHASFRVSSDEEHVQVEVGAGSDNSLRALPRRAFGYMLLTLARHRQHDQESGVAREDAGWVHADELAHRLDTTLEKLNVDIHRLRQVVSRLGLFEDPTNIVERRSGQLRIGVGDLKIARSPGPLEAGTEHTESDEHDSNKDLSKRLA
jgi:hypothetical protein